MSNTKTIARNTGWYGLENAASSIVTLVTSIAIARTLGPSKMGYIVYVSWIASVVSSLGSLGIPATTQKYMAEFLGMGDRGTARYIYFRTMIMQVALATVATGGILLWVLRDADSGYKLASALIAISIWPSMANSVSAQANVAAEQLSANMPASVISILLFFASIMATVLLHWGVVGVGVSILLMRGSDFLVRLFPTMNRVLRWETTHAHPVGLRDRMLSFAWQSVASMIVALIVWDRSEVVLLHHLCKDIRQIAFYTVAFNMAERLLVGSAIFGGAAGATIFAQYGRDKSRLPVIAASTFRYLALISFPLHFISTALAFPALILLFGNQYQGAAMVVTLAPILCMPKAFIGTVQSLLQSAERQSYVITATVFAGIIDIGVAWYLIPSHGAVGACIGSGAAQITAMGIMWAVAIHIFHVKLPWLQLSKIAFISTLAALTAHLIAVHLAPLWAVLLGGSASLVVLFGLLYLMQVLGPEDRTRFGILTGMLPKRLARPADWMVSRLIRQEFAIATPAND
jgi:O-antigen/teichoic acid export membrane protein